MPEYWNALYLKPRCEKKVATRLLSKGIDVFLPLAIIKKKYSDRFKRVEEPLLKSYIFVPAETTKNADILRTEGVMNYVYSTTTSKVAIIKKSELENIQNYLEHKIFEEQEWNHLQLGDTTVLTQHGFQGKQATIIEMKKNTIKLVIEDLGFVWEVSKK